VSVTPPATPPAATQLPLRLKLFHGLGSIAYGVKDNGFSTFLLIFYNQVIGLDAGLVGTAIMLALIADAFADPVIGELSDRTRTRWGRRLPWLFAAPLPLAMAWWALWHPPAGGIAAVVWLIGFGIVVRTLVSMCEVPSVALVPELTADYDERTILMRYRFLFGWAGGLALLMVAYGVFFNGPRGVADPDGYGAYALSGSVTMALAVLLSAWGQRRWVMALPPLAPPPAHGLRQILSEMRHSLSNRAFLWLIGAALFALVNQGITFSLNNYLLTYFWRLEGYELLGFAVMLFVSVGLAFVLVAPLSARLGKSRAAMVAGAISLTITTSIFASWLLRLFPGAPDEPEIVPLFLATIAANSFAITMMMLISSMMADVVEASQSETGRRSEGLFFAGYFFMQKCATGIGIFLAGLMLTFAAFPVDAVAGQVPLTVLDRLALLYMVTIAVLGIIGIAVLGRFPITREDHAARVAALDAAARTDPDAAGAHP